MTADIQIPNYVVINIWDVSILFQDQLEADDDLSLKQRLALAGGSAVEGVGDVTGIDAVNIAGKIRSPAS